MLEMVQAYVMRWRIKFNSRNSKREVGTELKIGEEIMEEVEDKYLGVWFYRKL